MEVLFGMVIAVFFLTIIYFTDKEGKRDGYKQGQADAIEGKVDVNLIEFEDGERKWYYKKDLKHLMPHKIIK